MHAWREHTAELELVIEAGSPAAVFEEAAAAFAELARPGGGATAEREERLVRLRARDRASLLVEWLQELIYLADTAGFVPTAAVVDELEDASLVARLDGAAGPVEPLVKAATYHRLAFEEEARCCRARVVLDV